MEIVTKRGPYRPRSGDSGKKEVQSRYYNFAIPVSLYDAVLTLAETRGTSLKEALCHLVAVGLSIQELVQDPNVSVTVHYGDGEEASVSWGWNAYLVFPSDRSQLS